MPETPIVAPADPWDAVKPFLDRGRFGRIYNAAEVDQARALAAAQHQQEVEALRETNGRLNRRCQSAEAALGIKVEDYEKRSKRAVRSHYFAQGQEYGASLAAADLTALRQERDALQVAVNHEAYRGDKAREERNSAEAERDSALRQFQAAERDAGELLRRAESTDADLTALRQERDALRDECVKAWDVENELRADAEEALATAQARLQQLERALVEVMIPLEALQASVQWELAAALKAQIAQSVTAGRRALSTTREP